MTKLYDLLGTKKVKEQEQRVQQLLDLAQIPVISVLVQMDPRKSRIDIRVAGVENAKLDDIKLGIGLMTFVIKGSILGMNAKIVYLEFSGYTCPALILLSK